MHEDALAVRAADVKAQAARLGWSADAVLLYEQLYEADKFPDTAERLTREAEVYGCRVETPISIEALKRIKRNFALVDGD